MIDGIETQVLFSLFGVAMCAGFFDAIAGGGGLVTLPALFLAGIDPVAAIATNKLQAAAATTSATVAFARKKMIDWRAGLPIAAIAAIGSFGGALSVSLLPRSALEAVVPLLLIAVALYFVLAPKMSESGVKAKISAFVFTITIAPLVGFYDGVFGPGVGSFFMLAFVSLLGFGILKAMSYTKLANAASNLGALLVFATKGAIIWSIALIMALGAFLGAQLGAACAVRVGPRLVRPMLVTICCFMAIKLLADPANPLRHAVASFFVP